LRELFDPTTIARYCHKEGIHLLVLFGSMASETAGSRREVDLAVQMRPGVQADKLLLIFDLEEIFDPYRVDVVILTLLTSPLLLHEIFSRGIALYEGAAGEFGKARLRAWKLYQDTAPLRRLEKRALESFVRRIRNVS
jgi:predicted nucleotidyltransferase